MGIDGTEWGYWYFFVLFCLFDKGKFFLCFSFRTGSWTGEVFGFLTVLATEITSFNVGNIFDKSNPVIDMLITVEKTWSWIEDSSVLWHNNKDKRMRKKLAILSQNFRPWKLSKKMGYESCNRALSNDLTTAKIAGHTNVRTSLRVPASFGGPSAVVVKLRRKINISQTKRKQTKKKSGP